MHYSTDKACQALLWVVLVALSIRECRTESTFPYPNFLISISSFQNDTGDWVVMIDTSKTVSGELLPHVSPRELKVDVMLGTEVKGTTTTTRLLSVATVPAVPGYVPIAPPAPLPVTTTTEAPRIPDGYSRYRNGVYYKYNTKSVTWYVARQVCENDNAHLVIVNSQEEANIIAEIMREHPAATYVHAGFNDMESEGIYVTIFGDSLSTTGFTRWSPGEPNNFLDEDCGAVHIDHTGLGLDDWWCHVATTFICELEV